jgi:hypothetical protein
MRRLIVVILLGCSLLAAITGGAAIYGFWKLGAFTRPPAARPG